MKGIKGRWGWYPCDYETYRKLKRLNFLAFQCLRRLGEHARWERKDPKNRVIRTRNGPRRDGHPLLVVGPLPEPVLGPILRVTANAIAADYRLARFPSDTEDVVPLSSGMGLLDSLLALAEEWYAAHGSRTRRREPAQP